MADPGYTPDPADQRQRDVELVAKVINDPLRGEAERIVAALAEAGRLLPPDAETRTDRQPSPFVSLSPSMRCGAPTLNHTRLPVSAIAGMLWAEKSVAAVCDDYEITRADVLIACWYLGMYGAYENRKWRKRWREWAEQVAGDLWKVTTVNYDDIPDPPLVGPWLPAPTTDTTTDKITEED